jgi:dTDP-glucose 4,6-dehydratase
VELLEADAATMPTPEGPVDDIIHSLVPDARTPLLEMKDFFPSATQRLLAIAPQKHSRTFLLCSTGAVYHPKAPPAPFAEGDPLTSSQGPITYGQIRRHVEDQCLNTLANSPTALKIARGFSFVGPRLPLDANFAIGNFIRDAQDRGPILVKGDGLPVRSYLYASDMAVWLWTILLKGEQGTAFNVGSEEATTIGDLARAIGAMFDVDVQSGSLPLPGAATASYLPLTTRARGELGLAARTSLRTGIEKMARWHGLPKPTTSI